MPELAEVEITRQKLLPAIRGRRILDFWTNWARGLRAPGAGKGISADMRGRKILNVERRGKVLFFKLSGRPERELAIHLGMSGRLEVTHSSASVKRERLRMRHPEPRPRSGRGISVTPRSARASRSRAPAATEASSRAPLKAVRGISMSSPEKWTHFRWLLSGGRELRFVDPRKFGAMWYGSSEDFNRDKYLGRLGRDPRLLAFHEFSAILNRGQAMIKPFLLRQDKFAGIGNIIADESLWRAKIHPRAIIVNLSETKRRHLFHEIQRTIRSMLSSGGTTLRNWIPPGGQAGNFQERRHVHGRAGKPCRRCRTKLKRIVVGGRGTTVCPNCQKFRG